MPVAPKKRNAHNARARTSPRPTPCTKRTVSGWLVRHTQRVRPAPLAFLPRAGAGRPSGRSGRHRAAGQTVCGRPRSEKKTDRHGERRDSVTRSGHARTAAPTSSTGGLPQPPAEKPHWALWAAPPTPLATRQRPTFKAHVSRRISRGCLATSHPIIFFLSCARARRRPAPSRPAHCRRHAQQLAAPWRQRRVQARDAQAWIRRRRAVTLHVDEPGRWVVGRHAKGRLHGEPCARHPRQPRRRGQAAHAHAPAPVHRAPTHPQIGRQLSRSLVLVLALKFLALIVPVGAGHGRRAQGTMSATALRCPAPPPRARWPTCRRAASSRAWFET